MPELPQVEALRGWLAEHLTGRVITRIQLTDFSALKTYQPPVDALIGLEVAGVARFGKFIDVNAQGVHLVFHLARAGWLTWKDAQPTALPGQAGAAQPAGDPGRRVRIRPHRGRHPTQAGHLRGHRPAAVAGDRLARSDPLSDAFDRAGLDAILAAPGVRS